MGGKINEKTRFHDMLFGFFLGVGVTLIFAVVGTCGSGGGLDGNRAVAELDKANQRESERLIGELEQSNQRQRDRIDDLEASNSRLESHLRGARGVYQQLELSNQSEGTDIDRAIGLYNGLTKAFRDLGYFLGDSDPRDGGPDGVDNDTNNEVAP
jgi:hypothetical protein